MRAKFLFTEKASADNRNVYESSFWTVLGSCFPCLEATTPCWTMAYAPASPHSHPGDRRMHWFLLQVTGLPKPDSVGIIEMFQTEGGGNTSNCLSKMFWNSHLMKQLRRRWQEGQQVPPQYTPRMNNFPPQSNNAFKYGAKVSVCESVYSNHSSEETTGGMTNTNA